MDDTTSGDRLLETISTAYEYTAPQRGNAVSTATVPYAPIIAPSLDRLPAFAIQVDNLDQLLEKSLANTLTTDIATNTIDLEAARELCEVQLILQKRVGKLFGDRVVTTEVDVAMIARRIIDDATDFLKAVYGSARGVRTMEQHALHDQKPDRVTFSDGSGFVGEDKSWLAFEHCAPQILNIANSPTGKQLKRKAKEEQGRAVFYKLAVAMSDSNLYWGFLFGGDGALLFQRCKSEEPTRYGVLCSGLLTIDRLFVTTLGMMLVPGDIPLVDVATLAIPVPAACSPGDNQDLTLAIRKILGYVTEDNQAAREQGMTMMSGVSNLHVWFSMPGYEFTTLQLSRTAIHSPLGSPPDLPPPPHEAVPLAHKELEEHFDAQAALPLSLQLPLGATPSPVLLVHERMSEGGTGVVFAGTIGSLPLIIKTIPPGFAGEADLRHEHHIYSTVLASLQGRVLPRMVGLFEGEGWTALVIEHCGNKVSDIHQLSLQQRETLWKHALEIHANGVWHADLELRNLIMSKSGELRIIDFAFSEVGHECEGGMCRELSNFRTLLDLP
ncbi:hypothetical protein BDZ89DRAFT_1066823 [Hymenopellis radicata]|nr:hypothetical protein BDZ89DRAFT_1066823 [Hymenopellis radicata]